MTTKKLNIPDEIMSKKDPEQYFQIVEKLGEGSYGSVWKAINKATGIPVAIKRVSIDNDLEDMKKEINFMKQCKSQHIVTYHGSFKKDNEIWIVMEYCGAGSVCDAMKITGKTLSEEQIAVVSKDCLQGLAYLHSVRKIHRDIKAGNILLNNNGESKLADFGVSGQLDGSIVKAQTVIGTPFWMAPEVIQEVGYDYKADIWSFGITCIEMAESKPPLFNVHPMRVIFMIPNPSRPPPKLTEPEKWSDEFNDFIALCLTRKPEQRPTAVDLLKHPFITRAKSHSLLIPLIDEQDQIIGEKGREAALGLDTKEDDEEEEEEEDDEESGGSDQGTMRPARRNNHNDDDEEEQYDSGTMVITENNNYDTMVVNNDDDNNDISATMKMNSSKKPFVPAYMSQFAKQENNSNSGTNSKYSGLSLEDLQKKLEEIELDKDQKIKEIMEKYNIAKQSLSSVIDEKKSSLVR
ncbi:protein serine/threonine kinase [Heterostelium album PN500]|uniref:non-specific serine/threonine protein kinase n=1 Tax=Heterostelium pallidum (strain ATCC 26659 / Pp 5 / PN500) TaxID=670386 RepID=D3BAM1_HETP5|nr:protein serine/threonine kinase [Heterostelium album PN500]EFA81608.1 protein serine/threonine kinase [Heterostelium album PN500]|eukprot:XP_020433725.1 protein serine/threonine kinase [Heterostelium album PN500]